MLLAMPVVLSCQSTDEKWSPDIYAGDHKSESVIRAQAEHSIQCKDERFSEMFCIFSRDMEKLLKKCLEDKPFWK